MEDFTQNNWNDYAKCYDVLQELRPYVSMLKKALRLCNFQRKGTILDVGCGTGNFPWIAKKMIKKHEISYLGIDSAPAMLNIAKAKNLDPCFSFVCSDIDQFLLESRSSFSTILSINSLYALKNPALSLENIFSNLKKGGFLILVTPKENYENGLILKKHLGDEGENEPWLDIHKSEKRELAMINKTFQETALRKRMKKLADFNRLIAKNNTFFFYKENELYNILKMVGFKISLFSSTYADQGILSVCEKI